MAYIDPLLFLFKLWMLIDSFRRSDFSGRWNYWFLICWIPYGDWVYFFAVNIHDPEFQGFFRGASAKLRIGTPRLAEIRYRAEHNPSAENRLTLARALIDHDQFSEADALLNELLRGDAKDKGTRYLLSLCKFRAGDTESAIPILEELVGQDLSCFDYTVALTLSEAYWVNNRKEESLQLLEKVYKKSHRLPHQVQYAKCLKELTRVDEARAILTAGLNDYEHAPRFIRKQYRDAAREAKSLLKGI